MKEDKLKKEVSGFSAFVMVIGTIIGSGVFFKPTAVFGAVHLVLVCLRGY